MDASPSHARPASLRHVALVGSGVDGASLLLAWKQARPELTVTRYDVPGGGPGRTTDSLEAAVGEADLVLLAGRLPAALRHLEDAAPHLAAGTLVTDTGAAKQPIARHAADVLPEGVHFVGGHPLAASAENEIAAGPEAGRFDDGTYLLCPPGDAPSGTDALRERHPGFLALAEATGARVVVRSAAAHDRLCATARDLPDLLLAALSDALSEAGQAGDHETLHALTDPALRPLLWGRLPLTEQRREELVATDGPLLDALGRYVRALQKTRRRLAAGDLDAALGTGDDA